IERALVDAPPELDARDDVAPLIGAAHLHGAIMPPRQLQEIIGLEHHVVELEEGERLLALEPQFDAVEAEHAVDREMPAIVPEEGDVVELVEPIGVVDHDNYI